MRRELIVALTVLAASGAGAQSGTPPWPVYPTGGAPPAWAPSIAAADLVIIEVHSALVGELHRKIEKGGPLLALGVCHAAATSLARQVGAREGVSVGLTSDRLRNPSNAPPAWAAKVIAEQAGRRAAAVEGFAVDLGDRVGVLRPLAEVEVCAACHGPAERMQPEVRSALERRYPRDRARGFTRGEIRGWFWVAVPKDGLAKHSSTPNPAR